MVFTCVSLVIDVITHETIQMKTVEQETTF